MDMSFQEKSLWLMLVGLVGGFGFYGATVLPAAGENVMPEQVVMFGLAVAMLVVVQIAGHIVLAVVDRRSVTDERDRFIALIGTRYASYVLATGIFAALCAALMTSGNFVFTHVLLASWVLAQLVEIGTQLFLYRRGA